MIDGIDGADHIRAEAEPLDRAGGEILAEDVGLLRHLLHQFDAARVLQIDRDRPLVGVVLQEVIGILARLAAGGAARIAELGVLHLHHIGAHPGERLGAGRSGLELRQVQHLHAGQTGLRAIARHRYDSLPMGSASQPTTGLAGRRVRRWPRYSILRESSHLRVVQRQGAAHGDDPQRVSRPAATEEGICRTGDA